MSLAFFHCARTGRLPVCDSWSCCRFFFFTDTATTEIYTAQYTLSLHDALPISPGDRARRPTAPLVQAANLLLRAALDRKSTRLNSSHIEPSRMPSSA